MITDHEPSTSTAVRSTSMNRRRVLVIALVLSAIVGVPMFVAQPATISGDSMQPTLHSGEHVLVDKMTFRFRAPRRGDLVIVADPAGTGSIVKRIVAVGGDLVGIEDGLLVLNGTTVNEDYTDQDRMDGYFHGPVVVPKSFVFLLGDNRSSSIDSRNFGPVATSSIVGRIKG